MDKHTEAITFSLTGAIYTDGDVTTCVIQNLALIDTDGNRTDGNSPIIIGTARRNFEDHPDNTTAVTLAFGRALRSLGRMTLKQGWAKVRHADEVRAQARAKLETKRQRGEAIRKALDEAKTATELTKTI